MFSLFGQLRLCPTSPSLLRNATSPNRGGLGITGSSSSSPEAPLLGTCRTKWDWEVVQREAFPYTRITTTKSAQRPFLQSGSAGCRWYGKRWWPWPVHRRYHRAWAQQADAAGCGASPAPAFSRPCHFGNSFFHPTTASGATHSIYWIFFQRLSPRLLFIIIDFVKLIVLFSFLNSLIQLNLLI